MEHSTPSLTEFSPLPQQLEIIRTIRKKFDYSKGTHEVMLSGSVGSSKSLTLAHIAVTHALQWPKSRFGIGRLALPQLKATLCQKIREHLFNSGVDYSYNEGSGSFKIYDSEIKAVSWSDQNLAKLGSTEFSGFGIEELTETKDPRPYDVILQRVNRLSHVKEPIVISATNPDAPSHWAYKKIICSKSDHVKVFYSNTYDNPYLPASYITQLKERLDPKMARRMINGEWIEIESEVLYHAYSQARNYKPDTEWVIRKDLPIRLMYDFNIGQGKPLSLVLGQYDPVVDHWHIFSEVIIDGQRTRQSLEEAADRGLLDHETLYIVHGDATGHHADTRSPSSDYDIIEKFLSNYVTKKDNRKLRYQLQVPRSNPGLRERHNIVNSYCQDANGNVKLFVYKNAPTCDEGMRLTKLKKGAQYLEDDKDRFQHCTTAIGYGVMYENDMKRRRTGASFSNRSY